MDNFQLLSLITKGQASTSGPLKSEVAVAVVWWKKGSTISRFSSSFSQKTDSDSHDLWKLLCIYIIYRYVYIYNYIEYFWVPRCIHGWCPFSHWNGAALAGRCGLHRDAAVCLRAKPPTGRTNGDATGGAWKCQWYPLVMTSSLLWKITIEIVDMFIKTGDYP